MTGASAVPGTLDPSSSCGTRTSVLSSHSGDVEPCGPFGAWGSVSGGPVLTPGANVANVVTVAGPDYSAWHYAPDAPVRLTRGPDGRVDLHILVGAWSAAPTGRRPSRCDGRSPTAPAPEPSPSCPASDVTPVDAEFADRLRTVDDAPVTGPRPLAVAPYRLALARRAAATGTRRRSCAACAQGATVRYTVDVRPTSGAPVTLGPYSVVAAVPEFTRGDVVGGRFGDLVDAGPAWVGHVRRDDGRHPRAGRPRRHPGRRAAAGPGAHRRHLALGRLPHRAVQPRRSAAAARLGRRHRDVQRPRPGRRARRVRRRRTAGRPRPTRAARGARGCSSRTSASRRSTTCSRSPSTGYMPPRTYMQVTMADERRPLLVAAGRRTDQPRRLPRRADDAPALRRALPPRAQRRRARAHRARLPRRPGRHARRPRRGSDAPGDRGLRVAPHPVLLGRGERPRHHGGRRGHHDLPRRRGAAARRVLPRPAALPAAARHGRGAADRARPLRRARLGHRLLRQRRLRRAVRRGLRPRARHAVDRPRRAARTCCSSTPR